MGMQRRIIEHQAGGMMPVQWRIRAEYRLELGSLVGTEQLRVAVHAVDVVVTAEEKAAVGTTVHRRMFAQCGIYRKGIGIVVVVELTQVKYRERSRCCCHEEISWAGALSRVWMHCRKQPDS